jgi:hypothetical protein
MVHVHSFKSINNKPKITGCRGRIRTSTEQLGDHELDDALSCNLHPRDRRACLPISTPYSIEGSFIPYRYDKGNRSFILIQIIYQKIFFIA